MCIDQHTTKPRVATSNVSVQIAVQCTDFALTINVCLLLLCLLVCLLLCLLVSTLPVPGTYMRTCAGGDQICSSSVYTARIHHCTTATQTKHMRVNTPVHGLNLVSLQL